MENVKEQRTKQEDRFSRIRSIDVICEMDALKHKEKMIGQTNYASENFKKIYGLLKIFAN